MARTGAPRDLGSVLSDMLSGLPHSGARKLVECQAMETLWECLPESLKGKCAPAHIHYIKNDDGAVRAVCELWTEDGLAWDLVLRERTRLLRDVAEKLGKVIIKDFSHRLVSTKMLRRQVVVVSGGYAPGG